MTAMVWALLVWALVTVGTAVLYHRTLFPPGERPADRGRDPHRCRTRDSRRW